MSIKKSIERPKPCLNYLIHPNFRGVTRLFVLSFPDDVVRSGHIDYFMWSVEIKNYNVMTDKRNFFV